MTQLSVMELAKMGDPHAIAALINRSLTSKGIQASAELESPQCLKISLQASQTPSQKAIITIIHRGMMVLQVEQIKSVKVFTYCSDNNYLAWQHEIILNNAPSESLPNPQIVKSTDSGQTRTNPEQATNLVKNSSGVLLVQKLSQIQQNLEEYQDVIVRFMDKQMGNVRCLTTLTELIQVISKPSFLFTTVASNPNLRSLLDAIAESSKTDEHGDQVITNLSILQPGQQWQKAKIRLVSKIFLEPAEDEQPPEDRHQGLTLDLIESQLNQVEPDQLERQSVTYTDFITDTDVPENEAHQDDTEDFDKKTKSQTITTDSLFDEFDSFPSSKLSTPSSISLPTSQITSQPIDEAVDDVTSSEITEIADWTNSPSLTVNSLFDDFPEIATNKYGASDHIPDHINDHINDRITDTYSQSITVRLVDDKTIPLDEDEDQDLFNNFGLEQRSPNVNSSSSEMLPREEDIDVIKSTISKQNLDKLLSLIEQEDKEQAGKSNIDLPSISSEINSQNINQLYADIGARTMERILGDMAGINKKEVDSPSSNSNKSPNLVTLEDFWGD